MAYHPGALGEIAHTSLSLQPVPVSGLIKGPVPMRADPRSCNSSSRSRTPAMARDSVLAGFDESLRRRARICQQTLEAKPQARWDNRRHRLGGRWTDTAAAYDSSAALVARSKTPVLRRVNRCRRGPPAELLIDSSTLSRVVVPNCGQGELVQAIGRSRGGRCTDCRPVLHADPVSMADWMAAASARPRSRLRNVKR